MIRIDTGSSWILIEHPAHAKLAGKFASRWGNAEFPPPEPRPDVLAAVFRHDDAWQTRDAAPFLTRQGKPSAFSIELVGKYSAFEEIDLADYLAVRGRAAESVAADNPYAAIVISMHTIDLLTAQADLSGLPEADRRLHADFVAAQRRRQEEMAAGLAGDPAYAEAASPARLRRAFELLQACDSLSLAACVRHPGTIPLRHRHPRRDGSEALIECTSLGNDTYRVCPYPFDEDEFVADVRYREVPGGTFPDLATFRASYAAATVRQLGVRIVR
jgi:hypothetical protein